MVSVLTQHNDNVRSGANLQETVLNASNVNLNQFGKLFSHAVKGQIYAQPLYVPFAQITGKGVHNVVIVVTMENWIYAFDADDNAGSNAQPLWAHQVGNKPPVPAQIYNPQYKDIVGAIGIVSTPAIAPQGGISAAAPSTGIIYLVLFMRNGVGFNNAFQHLLYALDLADGKPRHLRAGHPNPVPIAGSVRGAGYELAGVADKPVHVANGVVTVDQTVDALNLRAEDARNGRVEFNGMQQMQRPGLLLQGGVLYIAFGSHGDFDPYHGWVFAYEADTLQKRGVFCTTPNGAKGGIWQAGEGLSADAAGNVYLGTGNGDARPNAGIAGGPDLGESYIRLKLNAGGLALTGWLNLFQDFGGDEDLGASSPLLLPGNRMVGGGKDGNFYVLDPAALDLQGTRAALTQKFTASSDAGTRPNTNTRHIHGSPVLWDSPEHGPLVYVWGENDVLRAYSYDAASGQFPNQPDANGGQGQPVAKGAIYASNDMPARDGMPGAMLSVSADGQTPGSGIVWASLPPFANANKQVVQGELIAYDASRFDAQGRLIALWRSRQHPRRDDYGSFPKFCCPTIANGKVYQATFSNQLCVYGLLPQPDGGYNLGFGGTTGLTFNGSARVEQNYLRLTGLHDFQAGSVFSTAPVNVEAFQTTFRFLLTRAEADGFTFTIQSEGPRALGSPGGGMGYGPDPNAPNAPAYRITRSVAVKFDLFDNQTAQARSSTGLYLNGAAPDQVGDISLDAAGLDLHRGTPFRASLVYDGATLTVTITDENQNRSAKQQYQVDIPATTSPTAHVGFTGANGGKSAQQDILSWHFA